MKILMRLSLSLLLLMALAMIGCSDDSVSIVSPALDDSYGPGDLATESEWTGTEFDLNEYISRGYYDPDADQNDVAYGWNPGGHDIWGDVNNKPIDNGLTVD